MTVTHCPLRDVPVNLNVIFKRIEMTGTFHNSNEIIPNSKVHGANMGPIWGRQDPDGPHVGPMNFAIWDGLGWRQYSASSVTV